MSRDVDDKKTLLASFNLADCEYRGRVFDMLEPDQWIEERFFTGWRNDLSPAVNRWGKGSTASLFSIVDEDGVPAIDWAMNMPTLLVAGDDSWGDLTVSVDVRCIMVECFPYFHDETTFDYQGRTVVVFGEQDSRRHCFAGFQGGRSLVVGYRDDANWVVLNEAPFEVDRHRWYSLSARSAGDCVEVFVDGERRLACRGLPWATGPAGLFTNTCARWRNASISCRDVEGVRAREVGRAKTLGRLRGATPQPAKIGEVPLPKNVSSDTGSWVVTSLAVPLGEDFLMRWKNGAAGLLRLTREGDVVWRRELSAGDSAITLDVRDIDLDGRDEIVALDGAVMHTLDAETGRTKNSAPYPDGCPFITLRDRRGAFYGRCPKLWHTGGRDKPARIVLFAATGGGGHTVWSFDHELNHRWTHLNYAGKIGHDITAWDIDGDGRDEILLGYYSLDDDGNVVWRVRDQDLIFKQDHTDNLFCGVWDEAGQGIPKLVASCGEAGYILLDARDGAILRQQRGLGHVQRVCAGRFCHDLGGTQAWVATDWGSPGIFMLVDEHGDVLHRFQPDRLNTAASAVTWWPDGRQLLLMTASPRCLGLWDARGNRVVDFNETPILSNCHRLHLSGQEPGFGLGICRVPGSDTDVLLVNDGKKLNLFGPDSR